MKKLLVLLSVLGFASSAFAQAADGVTPYGQVRMWYGAVSQSKELIGSEKGDTDMMFKGGSSRIGINAKYGDLSGVIEFALATQNAGDNALSTRRIFVKWNATKDIYILAGQEWTPYYAADYLFGNISFNDSAGGGFGTSKREVQFKISAFGAFLDFINPYYPGQNLTAGSGTVGIADTSGNTSSTTTLYLGARNFDVLMPKIAAGYEYNSKEINAIIGGVYQQVTIVHGGNGAATTVQVVEDGKTVKAWMAYLRSKVTMQGVIFKVNANYGVNTGILGIDYSANRGVSAPANTTTSNSAGIVALPMYDYKKNAATASLNDVTTLDYSVELGYDLGVAIPKVGWSQVRATCDVYLDSNNKKRADWQNLWYAQILVPVVKDRLNFIPEVAQIDYRKNYAGAKEGKVMNYGLFVQAIF